MSAMDALLERSKSPGTFVERRRFTLARDKAIEKMKEFSLRDPQQYVLELIQGAVFAEAVFIAVDTRPDRLMVGWVGGRPYRKDELANLFDYLFANQSHRDHRHLVQLAIGLNALLQRSPKSLRVESGDGSSAGTVRLDLDKKGKGTLGVPETGLAGTYLVAELGGGWFHRFKGRSVTPEQQLIETRCRYTPVPILLNGSAPFGYRASRSITATAKAVQFDEGGRRGVLAPADKRKGGIDLVVGGVIVTRKAIPELSSVPLTGVICDDALRKTADQADIVQNPAYHRMLHAVQPLATTLGRQARGQRYRPPPLPPILDEAPETAEDAQTVEAEALPPDLVQLAPRPAITLAGLQRLVAVAAASGDRAAVFWTRLEDVDAVTASADPARFPFPVVVLNPGQAKTLQEHLDDVTIGRLSTTADADFVQRMLGRADDRSTVRIPMTAPQGTLVLTLHRTGPPPLWTDPAEGRVPARVSGPERSGWVGALDLPLSRISVAVEAQDALSEAGARRLARERLSGLVLSHLWRLVQATPDGPASHRLLAELTARLGLPHFVQDGTGVHLQLSFPAAGPEAGRALWGRPLCQERDGRPVTLARLVAAQGTDEVIHLLDAADLRRLKPLERKLGWGHLSTPALADTRLVVAVMDPTGWRSGPTLPHNAHDQAIVWIGACLDTPFPGDAGWAQATDAPRLSGVGFAVKSDHTAAVDWTQGLTKLFDLLRRHDQLDTWKTLSPDTERVRARGRQALLQLAGHLGEATLLSLPWLRGEGGRRATLEEVLARPRRAAHPVAGAQIDEPDTFALTLDALTVIRRHLGPDALPLRFDDPPTLWWNLQDPDDTDWLLRRRVDIPGLHGWLGLRRSFDDTTGAFVRAQGTWTALQALDPALPCHGLLWGDHQEVSLDDATHELLLMTRHELYTDLVERLQAGAWTGVDRAAAQAYAARFTAARAHHQDPETTPAQPGQLRIADDDRLAPLRGRLESIFGPQAGGVAFGMTAGDTGADAPMVVLKADDEGGFFGFDLNIDMPMVLRAAKGDADARTHLSTACHELLQRNLPQLRETLGHHPRLEAMAIRLVLGGADTPLITMNPRNGRLPFHLDLNTQLPVVRAAVQGPGPERELVLLECARQMHGFFAERGDPMDLHMVHRRLVAARLT